MEIGNENVRKISGFTNNNGDITWYPNCLNVYVSLIDNVCKRQIVKSMELMEVLTTSEYKNEVERIRAMDNEEEQKKAKKDMPAFCLHGEYRSLEAGAVPDVLNPLISVDVDEKDNRHLNPTGDKEIRDELKGKLAKLPYVAAVQDSIRGNGFFVIVLVEHPEWYADYYRAIAKALYEQLGVVVDKQCSDPSRLRFVSYDENPLFNPDVKPFKLTEEDIAASRQKKVYAPTYTTDCTCVTCHSHYNSTDDYGRVMEVIQQLEYENRDITDVQREWFEIGQSLANTFGEKGREMYHRVSRLSPTKYTPADCDHMFDRCLSYRHRSTFTIATFFYYATRRA